MTDGFKMLRSINYKRISTIKMFWYQFPLRGFKRRRFDQDMFGEYTGAGVILELVVELWEAAFKNSV